MTSHEIRLKCLELAMAHIERKPPSWSVKDWANYFIDIIGADPSKL